MPKMKTGNCLTAENDAHLITTAFRYTSSATVAEMQVMQLTIQTKRGYRRFVFIVLAAGFVRKFPEIYRREAVQL